MSRIQQVIDTLEAERAEVQERLAWLDQQINEFQTYNGSPATAAPLAPRAVSTARRASNRRATARSHQTDIKASIIEFLAKHPESTLAISPRPWASIQECVHPVDPAREDRPDPKASRGYGVK